MWDCRVCHTVIESVRLEKVIQSNSPSMDPIIIHRGLCSVRLKRQFKPTHLQGLLHCTNLINNLCLYWYQKSTNHYLSRMGSVKIHHRIIKSLEKSTKIISSSPNPSPPILPTVPHTHDSWTPPGQWLHHFPGQSVPTPCQNQHVINLEKPFAHALCRD